MFYARHAFLSKIIVSLLTNKKGVQPFVACSTSGYRQVTSYTNKHRTAHAKEAWTFYLLVLVVVEYWRYSNSREQELKAQYLKKLCLTATLCFFILFICIPTFAVGGCAVRLSSIILDWDQGSKPQCCVVSMSFLFLTLIFSYYLGHALILFKVSQSPLS